MFQLTAQRLRGCSRNTDDFNLLARRMCLGERVCARVRAMSSSVTENYDMWTVQIDDSGQWLMSELREMCLLLNRMFSNVRMSVSPCCTPHLLKLEVVYVPEEDRAACPFETMGQVEHDVCQRAFHAVRRVCENVASMGVPRRELVLRSNSPMNWEHYHYLGFCALMRHLVDVTSLSLSCVLEEERTILVTVIDEGVPSDDDESTSSE